MTENKNDEAKALERTSYSKLIFNVASGLLLAGFLYAINVVSTYLLTDRGEIYVVSLPKDGGSLQTAIFVENYSSREIESLVLSVSAMQIQLLGSENLERAEVASVGTASFVIRLKNILPNRQSYVLIGGHIDPGSLRIVSAPVGFYVKSKGHLTTWVVGVDTILPPLVSFVFYVAMMSYLDRKMSEVSKRGDAIERKQQKIVEERDALSERLRAQVRRIEERQARTNLVHYKRILNLSKENALWRSIFEEALKVAAKKELNAIKITTLMFKRLGIKVQPSLAEIEEENLIDLIQAGQAVSASDSSSP